MKPRCQGHHDGGSHTSFVCVLDEGHEGFCKPYVPPTVDEWRGMQARAAEVGEAVGKWYIKAVNARSELRAALEREKSANVDIARLQAENDALRAIIESGRAAT